MAGQDVPDWSTKAVALTFPIITASNIGSWRRPLKGTTATKKVTAVTGTTWTTLKFGVLVLGTPTNAGKHIYISGTGVTTGSGSIPATTGSFQIPIKKGKLVYLLGATGDHVNVWAL